VDEFLSEKEQLERIRDWWRENGWYLIGGAALGAVLLFGWTQYRAYQQQRVEIASNLYQEMSRAVLDRAEVQATDLLNELRAEYPSSPYTDQAGLLYASLMLDQQRSDDAVAALRYVLGDTDDPELTLVVRLRLARLFLHLDRLDEALAVIGEVGDPGRFVGLFTELRGDIYLAQGDSQQARTAYLEAFNSEYPEVVDRNMLQMKIDDLPATATAAATAPAASAGAAAEGEL
jgi:predicted negative regulator of RcsB-dependent stress response